MGTYKLSPDAENDLSRIWLRGLHKHGEVQANKYYYEFIKRFELIAEQPYLYQSVDYIR